MANEEKFWAGTDLKKLRDLVNQIDRDVVATKNRVKSLEENVSLKALIGWQKRTALAAEGIRAALEKQNGAGTAGMIDTVKKITVEQAAQEQTMQDAVNSPVHAGKGESNG